MICTNLWFHCVCWLVGRVFVRILSSAPLCLGMQLPLNGSFCWTRASQNIILTTQTQPIHKLIRIISVLSEFWEISCEHISIPKTKTEFVLFKNEKCVSTVPYDSVYAQYVQISSGLRLCNNPNIINRFARLGR